MSGTVVVVSGGSAPAADAGRGLPADAFVIAADSGLDHARQLGLRVDLVVGDLDSVSPGGLATAEGEGIAIEAHPAAKDQTDLELAMDRALERHPDRIVVLGPDGGRLDHLVAGGLVLAAERYAEVATVEARLGPATVTVVRRAAQLHGGPGDLLTLVPVGGPAIGVATEGLVYPLADEDLAPGTTRGVSNEFVAETARVTVRRGVLLAIQPGRH
jgi:thiamine pyrophosphokinase